MEVLYASCCGLDVHAQTVVACRIVQGKKEIRTFSTMTDELLQLADWLTTVGCTHVAIESTGVYWKPVFNILEGSFTVVLVNARHIKAVPGRKTDVREAQKDMEEMEREDRKDYEEAVREDRKAAEEARRWAAEDAPDISIRGKGFGPGLTALR